MQPEGRPGANRISFAFRVHLNLVAVLDDVGGEKHRLLADEDLTRGRLLLKSCCRVHHVASGERIRASADDGLARMHPGPEREFDAKARPQRVAQADKRLMHLQRTTNRALRIVLVQSRNAEDGNDGVPHELLYRAAELLDDGPHSSEIRALDALNRLGIQAFPERRRADKVAEENGYKLALARDTHKEKRSRYAGSAPDPRR